MNGRSQTGVAFAASVAAYQANRIRRHELTRSDKENDRVRNIVMLNGRPAHEGGGERDASQD